MGKYDNQSREELEERLEGWQSMTRLDHLMTGIFGPEKPGTLKHRVLKRLGI